MPENRIYAAVELRAGDDGPPRLCGVLMRYGAPGEHGREIFAPGSLSFPVNGIRIDLEHASSPARGAVQPPIMRAVPFVSDDGAEVRIDAPIPDTTAGRDLAVLMRSDPPMYSGLSVEFRNARDRYAAGRRTIHAALLVGAALTDNPSYTGTAVEVRDGEPDDWNGVRRRIWL